MDGFGISCELLVSTALLTGTLKHVSRINCLHTFQHYSLSFVTIEVKLKGLAYGQP